MDKDDEEKTQKVIEQQIERALASRKTEDEATVYTELQRDNEEEKGESWCSALSPAFITLLLMEDTCTCSLSKAIV